MISTACILMITSILILLIMAMKIFPTAPAMHNTRQVAENYRAATGDGKVSTSLFIACIKNIKAEKKHVKFGLSPFGIWRPGYPESVVGFDQYDQLYADAKLWLNKGWIDYFSPQLYWPINRIPLSFPVLLGWWANENKKNRHLWPGISVGRDTSAKDNNRNAQPNHDIARHVTEKQRRGSLEHFIGYKKSQHGQGADRRTLSETGFGSCQYVAR